MPKHIIFQCGMDFQFVLLHIAYEFQHFEPIEYANSVARFILTFETNDSKAIINLNEFSFLSKPMVWQVATLNSNLKFKFIFLLE
jgi:thymidine kinase